MVTTFKESFPKEYAENYFLFTFDKLDKYFADNYDMDDALYSPHSEEAVGNWSEPYIKEGEDTGRNDPCPCGSGKKYKKCCLNK